MKTVKIILFIIVGVAALVGILKVPELIGSGDDNTGISSPKTPEAMRLDSLFASEWAGVRGWNAEIYAEQLKKVDNKVTDEKINRDEATSLVDVVRGYALVSTFGVLDSLMKAPKWSVDEIDTQFVGIDSASRSEIHAGKDEVKIPRAVRKLYDEGQSWIGRYGKLTASGLFRGVSDELYWTPFNDIVRRVEAERDKVKSSTYYNSYVANKLDDTFTETSLRLESLKNGYYDLVVSAVKEKLPNNKNNFSGKYATIKRDLDAGNLTQSGYESRKADLDRQFDKAKAQYDANSRKLDKACKNLKGEGAVSAYDNLSKFSTTYRKNNAPRKD